MNDALHNKVVKWFYDHEELLIAIMNKTPYQSDGWDYEIEVVKEFLTQTQQEPVAWITQGGKGWLRWHKSYDDNKDSVPLYTTPPQRTWVGLTDEEANELWESTDSDWELMKRTEAKLKEKNT